MVGEGPTNTRSGKRIGRLALTLASVFCIVACNRTFAGAWSLETKRNILHSLLFTSADAFEPDVRNPRIDVPEDVAEQLEGKLASIVGDVGQRYRMRRATAAVFAGARLPDLPKMSLQTVSTGSPVAHVQADGEMRLDLSVVRALYLATTMTPMPLSGAINRGSYSYDNLEADTGGDSGYRSRRNFIALKRRITATRGSCFVTSVLTGWNRRDNGRDGFFTGGEWAQHADVIAEWDARYVGALVFLVAHELGHLLLHDMSQRPADEPTFQADELEADAFAATLIGDALGSQWTLGGHQRVTTDMTGFELYFRLAERMAGFDRRNAEGTFAHPPSEQRLEYARNAYYVAMQVRKADLAAREHHKK